jgi:hypothetical protein
MFSIALALAVAAAPAPAPAQTVPLTPAQEALGELAYTTGRCFAFVSYSTKLHFQGVMQRQDPYTSGFMRALYFGGIEHTKHEPVSRAD